MVAQVPEGSFEDLLQKMQASAFIIVLQPAGEPDMKISCELGAAILLNKPILLLRRPGQEVPAKLSAVVDQIFEMSDNPAAIRSAMTAMLEKLSVPDDEET